ncbi:hypothetical protein BN1723_003162 [Verticillium longisporum]|uniref:Uncharacterized protein n=1 Tax=Verticillium longisporum TaxID=100787 RepID=A0A0G4LRN7_VERLO|nr:hypothetical protein BN1723_003162 [Verticillium longisporum]
MAAPVGPLTQVKLPSGPSPVTAEQRYWQSFKNQLQIPSPTTYPITHISGASNDGHFAVTTGTRVQIYSVRTRKLQRSVCIVSRVVFRRESGPRPPGPEGGLRQGPGMEAQKACHGWETSPGLWVYSLEETGETGSGC